MDVYWFEVYAFAWDAKHGDAPFFVFRSKYREEAVAMMLHLPKKTRSHILRRQEHECQKMMEYIPFN
jgi:hypothetical protein